MQPRGDPVPWEGVDEQKGPILTNCGWFVRKSLIQAEMEVGVFKLHSFLTSVSG